MADSGEDLDLYADDLGDDVHHRNVSTAVLRLDELMP